VFHYLQKRVFHYLQKRVFHYLMKDFLIVEADTQVNYVMMFAKN